MARRIAFDLRLRLRLDGGKDSSMGHWIDDFDKDAKHGDARRNHKKGVFRPQAEKTWEALGARIKADVERLNTTPSTMAAMKGPVLVDQRETGPTPDELFLDKEYYPTIYLTVRLSIGGECIEITQRRTETPNSRVKETKERLPLELTEYDQVVITHPEEGGLLTIEKASEYILRRFLS